MAAEGDEVGVARRNGCRGTLTGETARRDQCTAEFSPQMLGCDRSLALDDLLDALDPRLDHVKIGDAQSVEIGRDIAKGSGRVAVRHRSVGAARRDADAHAIGTPDGNRSLGDL